MAVLSKQIVILAKNLTFLILDVIFTFKLSVTFNSWSVGVVNSGTNSNWSLNKTSPIKSRDKNSLLWLYYIELCQAKA